MQEFNGNNNRCTTFKASCGVLKIRDRRRYLRWVFAAKKRFGLSVLNYRVTPTTSIFWA